MWSPISQDEVGISVWGDFRKTVYYTGVSLAPAANDANDANDARATPELQQQQQVRVQIGNGFWSSLYKLASSFWGIPNGNAAVARVLVVGAEVVKVEGRNGTVVFDDPWMGAVMDWGIGDDAGWAASLPVPTTTGWRPTGVPTALQVPYSTTSGRASFPVQPVTVTPLASAGTVKRWLYTFDRNIVGHAALVASSVSAAASLSGGNLTLRHCENINATLGVSQTTCLPLAHLPDQPDTHLFPAGYNGKAAAAGRLLAPRFTWHGFQHVIVEAEHGVVFDGKLNSLVARWTASNLEDTAAISFEGPGADMLAKIRDIVKASQLSNMAAYGPTDCPTREKHFWLGDAATTAEEAMYNLWTPGTYELFADEIRNSQDTNASSPWFGFVKGVVPAETEGPTNHNPPGQPPSNSLFPDDISWTAAYPLIVNWLLLYYGDVGIVEEHWAALKLWTDGQKRQMLPTDGLPCFYMWGDWCQPFEPRHNATISTGPPSSAANYILSVEAMVAMAKALGETDAAAQYQSELAQWRAAYHKRFWVPTSGTYTANPLEVQTTTSTALGAGAVPPEFQKSAVKALVDNVADRDFHLTVGSVGQKWLLRELTAAGEHDSALKLGLQTTYPSFGHWLENGATTCWENWSGICDDSHPGTPWPGHPGKYLAYNSPTHNHIFLCGGVGEWMYRSLGGIAPATPGYATVTIAPKVSTSEGPSGVNASVTTIRGVVKSSWVRHTASGKTKTNDAVFELKIQIPVGSHARVTIPLLHANPHTAVLEEVEDNLVLWTSKDVRQERDLAAWLRKSPHLSASASGEPVLEFETAAGRFHFLVRA